MILKQAILLVRTVCLGLCFSRFARCFFPCIVCAFFSWICVDHDRSTICSSVLRTSTIWQEKPSRWPKRLDCWLRSIWDRLRRSLDILLKGLQSEYWIQPYIFRTDSAHQSLSKVSSVTTGSCRQVGGQSSFPSLHFPCQSLWISRLPANEQLSGQEKRSWMFWPFRSLTCYSM